jgi:hypothetical protein
MAPAWLKIGSSAAPVRTDILYPAHPDSASLSPLHAMRATIAYQGTGGFCPRCLVGEVLFLDSAAYHLRTQPLSFPCPSLPPGSTDAGIAFPRH